MLSASAAPDHQLVWTMEQLLERVAVSRSTIYRWIEREGLPVVRIRNGSNPLFLPESVLSWFQAREQQKAAVRQASAANTIASDSERVAELRRTARRPRLRKTPPPPLATAGSRERLRRINGAR